jgi:hypothetical protein
MKRLVLTALLLCVSAAHAEEEVGPRCELLAVVDEGDAGMLKIYDGLRKGLELAQLPRVCREPVPASKAERQQLLARLEKGAQLPLFAVGDTAVHALAGPMPEITRVFAFERYTIAGRPLLDLPVWDRLAIVYAARPAERVGEILRRLVGKKEVRVHLPQLSDEGLREASLHFGKAAGLVLTEADAPADAVLHLRLLGQACPLAFPAALALARRWKVPLLSDARGRFGQGATVTLVGRHDLLGKAAAEAGRRLRKDAYLKIPPFGLPGIDVWVDLAAADAQGLRVPLPFLARADRLERSRSAPAKAK